MHRHLIPKIVGAIVLLTALGGGAASAFTASNSVPISYAGQGTGQISGYTVYNIDYGTCQTWAAPCLGDPGTASTNVVGSPQDAVNSVSFQLAPDNAQFVAVQIWDIAGTTLLGGGGGSSHCSEGAAGVAPQDDQGNTYGGPWNPTLGVWTCNVHPVGVQSLTVSDIGALDVEAAQ
jgi:hypothetical protein